MQGRTTIYQSYIKLNGDINDLNLSDLQKQSDQPILTANQKQIAKNFIDENRVIKIKSKKKDATKKEETKNENFDKIIEGIKDTDSLIKKNYKSLDLDQIEKIKNEFKSANDNFNSHIEKIRENKINEKRKLIETEIEKAKKALEEKQKELENLK